MSYGVHTLMKIISVLYYAHVFTTIVKGPRATWGGFDGAVYVDLFAGPGHVQIGQTDDFVVGSPLAAMLVKKPFDLSIFVEIDGARATALERTLKTFFPSRNFVVIPGNANEKIDSVLDIIRRQFSKPIILTFIDPEGMEVEWGTAKKLAENFSNTDFIFNVSQGVDRVAAALSAGKEGFRQIFEKYFGDKAEEILLRYANGEPIDKSFERNIKDVLGKPMGRTIPIKDVGDRVRYYVMGYTRTGGTWARAFDDLYRRISPHDGNFVSSVLDRVKKRQSGLNGA